MKSKFFFDLLDLWRLPFENSSRIVANERCKTEFERPFRKRTNRVWRSVLRENLCWSVVEFVLARELLATISKINKSNIFRYRSFTMKNKIYWTDVFIENKFRSRFFYASKPNKQSISFSVEQHFRRLRITSNESFLNKT